MKVTKRYAKYKIAGQAWMGQIPDHWEVKKIKYLFSIRKEIAGKLGYHVLSITQGGIKIKDVDSGVGQLAMDYSKYQMINVGDFAMNHMDLLTGYVDISRYNGVISPDYRVFKLTDKKSLDRYFLYLLQFCYQNRIFYALGQGSSQLGRWRLAAEEFNMFEFPCPPLVEQNAIVHFLDKKTEEIRNFIALKERTIELLKARKAVIIDAAVIKGLDRNVEMKDSGIEWIGKIPSHWEVKKLKYLAKNLNNRRIPLESSIRGTMVNPTYDYYGATGVIDKVDSYIFDEDLILIAEDGANLLFRNIQLIYIASGKYWVNNHAHILKPEKGVNINYLASLMESMDYATLLTGSAQPKLTKEALMDIFFLNPPISEQEEIVRFIKEQSKGIDQAIIQAQREIDLISTFRLSLINEAITGKIDVRGEAIMNNTLSYSHHEV